MTFAGYIGAGLVTSGCAGLGISMALSLKKRLKLLSSIVAAIDYIQAEISYGLTPLPELLNGLAGRDAALRDLWNAVAGAWKPGESFSNVWTDKVSELDLKESDRLTFGEIGTILGRYDADRQVSRLAFIKKRLELSLAEAREELKKNGKLFCVLGIACGLAAAILLI